MRYTILALSYILCLPTVQLAGTVQPDLGNRLVLSNFQATSVVTPFNDDGISMLFSEFAFSSIQWTTGSNGETLARLSLGGGGRLQSNTRLEQSIQATATVDYTLESAYRVSRIQILGSAIDDGTTASEGWGIRTLLPSPCTLGIWGSNSFGNRTCSLPENQGDNNWGTISAWMFLHTDRLSNSLLSSLGMVQGPTIELTIIHNPEPETKAMMLIAGVGLIIVGYWRKGG